jgi:uncharacterized metal-binding protein
MCANYSSFRLISALSLPLLSFRRNLYVVCCRVFVIQKESLRRVLSRFCHSEGIFTSCVVAFLSFRRNLYVVCCRVFVIQKESLRRVLPFTRQKDSF